MSAWDQFLLLPRRNIGDRFPSVKRHYSRSLRLCVRNVRGPSTKEQSHSPHA
jgi:hypothetical protein